MEWFYRGKQTNKQKKSAWNMPQTPASYCAADAGMLLPNGCSLREQTKTSKAILGKIDVCLKHFAF